MKKIINIFVLLFILSHSPNIWGFSLFKNCIKQDQSFHHHIVDPNTLKLFNREEYSVSLVQCVNITGRYPFSFFDTGTPLHPDDSIKIIGKDKNEVCESDTLYVYDKECIIITMSKPVPTEDKMITREVNNKKPFILWRYLEDQKKTIEQIP